MAFFEITKAAILFFVFCHSVELPQANNEIQDGTHAGSTSPLGHMQKLGSHMNPFGVTFVGKFNNPAVFYNHFIKPGKPLQFKNVLEDLRHPGLSEWTDKYLKHHYGEELVKVEESKKERRGSTSKWMPFKQFLSLYLTEDIYMVHSLANKMEALALVPLSVQCGGAQQMLQEAVLWMGSGSATSVLHKDGLDNIMCLMDGRKTFVLIDKAYQAKVEQHGFNSEGGYSLLDVDRVDMSEYSFIQDLPWHQVHMEKGDCIFVPRGWYHSVRSDSWRHMAINLWFSHSYWFNASDCPDHVSRYRPLEPLSSFGFASPNEVYRTRLLDLLQDKGPMTRMAFMDALRDISKERKEQFFKAVDKYSDQALSWSELQGFDIDKAVLKFPEFFSLPGNPVASESDEDLVLYSWRADEVQRLAETDGSQHTSGDKDSKTASAKSEVGSQHSFEEKYSAVDKPKENLNKKEKYTTQKEYLKEMNKELRDLSLEELEEKMDRYDDSQEDFHEFTFDGPDSSLYDNRGPNHQGSKALLPDDHMLSPSDTLEDTKLELETGQPFEKESAGDREYKLENVEVKTKDEL